MNRRQTIPKHLRYTIDDFNRQFPNNDACIEHLKEQRFPKGVAFCEPCHQEQKHHRIHGRPVYACDACLNQISPMAGTIFEHSSTRLRLWYYAMYLMASTRCGISAKQIQRETGVTYKTAWRMFRQIRTLLSEDVTLEGEAVEMDETYMDGKRKAGRGRPMRGDKTKTPVVGIAERKEVGYLPVPREMLPSRRCSELSKRRCFQRVRFSLMNIRPMKALTVWITVISIGASTMPQRFT
jgi:hypothetical protein